MHQEGFESTPNRAKREVLQPQPKLIVPLRCNRTTAAQQRETLLLRRKDYAICARARMCVVSPAVACLVHAADIIPRAEINASDALCVCLHDGGYPRTIPQSLYALFCVSCVRGTHPATFLLLQKQPPLSKFVWVRYDDGVVVWLQVHFVQSLSPLSTYCGLLGHPRKENGKRKNNRSNVHTI